VERKRYENCPDFLRQAGRSPLGDTKEATRPGSPPFLFWAAALLFK
jgi:hypothetical protein